MGLNKWDFSKNKTTDLKVGNCSWRDYGEGR